jgi:hypothetical protein
MMLCFSLVMLQDAGTIPGPVVIVRTMLMIRRMKNRVKNENIVHALIFEFSYSVDVFQ